MKRTLLIVLFSLSLSATPMFQQEPQVRVRIINSLDTLNMVFAGDWVLRSTGQTRLGFTCGDPVQLVNHLGQIAITDSAGTLLARAPSFILNPENDTSQVWIRGVPYGVGWWWAGEEDRLYEGTLHIFLGSEQEMNVVVQLPLETYLKGVVPYEIGGDSPLEALKAQAVAARSEAIVALNSKLYSGPFYDLTSDVECQVFSGNHRRTLLSDQAVTETRGWILSEDGHAMNAYYASNCGGRSEMIQNVWPDRPRPESYTVSLADNASRKSPRLRWTWLARRWIQASPDVFCNPDSNIHLPSWSRRNFRWTREFTRQELTEMLTKDPELGPFRKIRIKKRGPSGRIHQARIVFQKGAFEVRGELALRQLFNPALRSSNFYVEVQGDKIILRGAGWGHGVGMCQSGAVAQAMEGRSCEQILKHYYSRARLFNIYEDETPTGKTTRDSQEETRAEDIREKSISTES